MKKAFEKFGFDLRDPDTGLQLDIPKSICVTHDYKTRAPEKWEPNLGLTLGRDLTQSTIGKLCTLCGSSTMVEMHHIKSVADVRQKFRNHEGT